jgi:methylglutaconyl-CoA hydratase
MQALRIERDGELLRVTMARPERRNAFDAALIAELTEAFGAIGDDVRAVLLAGDGPSFCAGADVEWQRASIDLTFEENVEDALRLHAMLAALDSCPAPLVARVQGYALGGGSGLVACADVVVAAPEARSLFVTGERFDADTALRIGLVDEVADDLDAAVERQVGAILKSGPEATRAAKRLTRERPPDPSELARIAAGLRAGDEGQEGLRAFLEKRDPAWASRSSL